MAESPIRFPVLFCLLVDFPDNNIDCASFNESCYQCSKPGKFLTGNQLDEHGSLGHAICTMLLIFIVLIGIFGACANCLIMIVLRKHPNPRAFDSLLIILASFDLITTVTAVISSISMVVYYEGLATTGPEVLILYYVPFLICFNCFIGRSGSVYMTIIITIERYLIIASPLKAAKWFTPKRIKLIAMMVVIFTVTINAPRYTSVIIDYNDDKGQAVPSLQKLTYVLKGTCLEKFWYETLGSLHVIIDIWMPFPILVIFNILLYIEIERFKSKRNELNPKLKRDIRAARMFVPVVVMLCLCNIEPCIHYAVFLYMKVYYRELVLGMSLSVVINSSANLPIYYARGCSFRQEIRGEISKWFSIRKQNVSGPDLEISLRTQQSDNDHTIPRCLEALKTRN